MMNKDFLGAIQRASVVSDQESRHLGSSEAIIGCECTLVYAIDEVGYPQVQVVSPHGSPFGAFAPEFSEKLARLHNLGDLEHVFLSALGYTEEDGVYWGEFTVIMFPPEQKDIWDTFAGLLKAKIETGMHPDVKLSPKATALVIDAGGDWCDLQKAPYAKLQKGVYVKKRRGTKDDLLDKARSNNPGCVFAAWVFWIVVIAAIVFAVWWFLFR